MSGTYDTSWSELPEDLLILIARKLQRLGDALSFRSVCVSWRSASNTDRTPLFPLLLQFTYMFDYARSEYYNTATKFSHKCHTTRFFLGWKGWVLVVDEHGQTMCLQHAFKETTPISLPEFSENIYYVFKAVLSSDPFINPFDYTLAVVYAHGLALWRPGDKSYTMMHHDINILDAIFYGGLLYVVNHYKVAVFDVAGLDLITSYNIDVQRPSDTSIIWPRGKDHYLVELGGDLVLLYRSYEYANPEKVYQFNVFLVSDSSEWKEITDLGNRAIFVGANSQSFALDNASELQGCLPNRITLRGSDM